MSLETLLEELRRREPEGERLTYRVPGLWAPVGESPTEKSRTVNPYRFLRGHVEAILSTPPAPRGDDDWVKDARIYNMFVRLTAAYDHDGDGRIATPDAPDRAARTLNGEGVRETGTFLKAIALLGHAKRMGCDTIHLLPVTAVGAFGNKGNLGSPYAIANPYRLEPTLADPLSAADVETQFAAFVEACHRLGMRVVVEFVFRTSSRDGDQVAKHPEWFYWIRREIEDRPAGAAPDDARYYGLPPFSEDDLKIMKEKVAKGEHTDLPPPPQWYRDLFKAPPARDTIQKEADGRWRGTAPDGTVVHVPSAFADWPPDDYQPPWTDVTYLRVYDRPKFNYIAYNTIRMYDEELAAPENAVQPLWDSILGIIPHYQDEFGVDGVMVDMGHALPHELMHRIIVKAREKHPHFGLLSENFTISEESVETGYNSVLGYQFRAVESAAQMRALIERSCVEGLPIAAFGTPETHNTPRAAMRGRGAAFCRTTWLLNNFLADTIPFIHAGYELGEEAPVNLGLAFTPEEMAQLSGKTLGLFDISSLHWDEAGNLPGQIQNISALRTKYAAIAAARGEGTLVWSDQKSPEVLAFFRCAPQAPDAPLLFVLNWSTSAQPYQVALPARINVSHWEELLSGSRAASTTVLSGTIAPCDALVFGGVGAQ